MDWMRSREVLMPMAHPREPLRRAEEDAPKFVLVDSKNRVRELTDAPPLGSAPGFSPGFASLASRPIPVRPSMTANGLDDDDMDDDDDELAQQLRVQREEMQLQPRHHAHAPDRAFTNSYDRERDYAQPHLAPLAYATSSGAAYPPSPGFAASYSPQPPRHGMPPQPPISPFAGLALSASAPSNPSVLASKPPVNPFGHLPIVENSPRLLPSLNALRAGSPRDRKLGIATRPSGPLLRSTSELLPSQAQARSFAGSIPPLSLNPSLNPTSLQQNQNVNPNLAQAQSQTHLRSPHLHAYSSSLPSPHTPSGPFSQSLPGVSFLHDRLALSRQVSYDGSESMATVSVSSEDDEREPALMMMRLSSSVPSNGSAGAAALSSSLGAGAPRSGRVCRYADCNNIARSRGLCRTHGGGKRCSHPGCNKSAQANRKCIAHGGGTPCSFENCEKTAQSRGLCKAHGGGARCKYPNCPKSSQSKGLCRGHGGGIKCKEEGCEKWVQKNGYCIKHGRERAVTQ